MWGEDFELVEHFATDLAVGDALTDSTGKVTGTLVGSELTAVTDSASALPGSGSVRFDSSRLQYDGNVGASAKKFTVSGIFALTPGDIAAIGGERNALVARSVPGAEEPTMELGLRKADGLFQALTPFDDATTTIPTDAEPHLVTVTFDEMTYAVFVDGVETHSAMAEGRRFPNLFDAPLTVGDSGVDPDDPNRLLEPFLGVVDELWIATMPFIPEPGRVPRRQLLRRRRRGSAPGRPGPPTSWCSRSAVLVTAPTSRPAGSTCSGRCRSAPC